MDKNTWLNIYQAYSLEKISSLNKHGLAMQYAQCEQLVKLNKELAATNATPRRILQNQIREIETRNRYPLISILPCRRLRIKIIYPIKCFFPIFFSKYYTLYQNKQCKYWKKYQIRNTPQNSNKE